MLMSATPGWFARILCPTAERLFVCAHVHFTVLVRLPRDALRLPVPSPSGSSRRNNVTRSNRPLPPLSSLSLDLKLLERRSKRARDAKKRQAKAHLIGREDQGPALRKLGGRGGGGQKDGRMHPQTRLSRANFGFYLFNLSFEVIWIQTFLRFFGQTCSQDKVQDKISNYQIS